MHKESKEALLNAEKKMQGVPFNFEKHLVVNRGQLLRRNH